MNSTLAKRPLRATGMAGFCLLTIGFLVYRDLFLPHVGEVEVWFGIEFRGWAARLTAPLHWLIFAAGAEAFWSNRSWIWRASAGYAFYIALSHGVWNLVSPSGGGGMAALAQFVAFCVPVWLLLQLDPSRRGRAKVSAK